MAKSLTTQIIFNGVNNVSRTISGIAASVSGLSSKLNNIGNGFRNAGFQAMALSMPAMVIGKEVFDSYAEWEDVNVRLKAVAEATTQEMAGLAKQQKELAASSPFNMKDIADAQFAAAQAGMTIKQINGLMADFVNGATVMDMSIADTTDVLNSIVTGFSGQLDLDQKKKEIKEWNDLMAWAAIETNSTAAEMGRAFKEFAPMAKIAGMDKYQSAAVLSGLSLSGFKDTQSAKALRTIMLRVASPAKKGLGALNGLGVDTRQFFKGDAKPLDKESFAHQLRAYGVSDKVSTNKLLSIAKDTTQSIQQRTEKMLKVINKAQPGLKSTDKADLYENLYQAVSGQSGKQFDFMAAAKVLAAKYKEGKIGPAEIDAIFGKERAAQATAILKNWDKIIKMEEKAGTEAQGKTQTLSEQMAQSLKRVTERMANSFDTLGKTVFNIIDDDMKNTFKKISEIVDGITAFVDKNPAVARMAVALVAVTAALAPLLIAIGLVASGLSALVGLVGMFLAPLAMAARGVSLLAAAMFGASRTSRMALLGLARFSLIGAAIGAAGLVIYGAFGKIREAFAAVDWQKVGLFASGTMKALMSGDWARAATHIKEAWREIEPAVLASLQAIKDSAVNMWNGIVSAIDSYTPNFANFRSSIGNLTEALKGFFDLFTISDGSLDKAKKTFSEYLQIFANAAWQTGADAVNAVAGGIRSLTAAIKAFKEGYGKGGVFEGLKEALDSMSGSFRLIAISAGIWGMASGLTALKAALVAMKGINLAAMFAGLGPVKIFLAAAAIGYLADKLGALDWINKKFGTHFDWVDAFSAALLGLSVAKLLGGFFAGATSASSVAGIAAGKAYGLGFGSAARLALKGLGAWAAYEIVKDMPTTKEGWQKLSEDNNKRDASASKWLADNIFNPLKINFGWGKNGQGDYANSPMAKLLAYVTPKFATNSAAGFVRPYTGDSSGMQASAAEMERRRTQMEGVLDPSSDPANSWHIGDRIAGVIYELMKPTRDRLFAEVPVSPSIPHATTDQLPGKAQDDTIQLQSLAEAKNSSAASNRAAAAAETQAGKIDQTNALLSQVNSSIQGLSNVMGSIPGALSRAVSANIKANNGNPKTNVVNSNGGPSPTTLGHR